MTPTAVSIADVLGPQGLLASHLDGYEYRSSQGEMARLIETALIEKRPALVEAGTGTGKTFGYLVPVILSGRKVVISTGTKNLQEQIFFKDVPLIKTATDRELDAMILKGRKNYLCLHRYYQYFSHSLPLETRPEVQGRLGSWLERTEFGDRAELLWLADDDALWDTLSATSDQCLAASCLYFDDCFLNRLRRRAAEARVIITNHHLFFADLRVKRGGFGEIIPRFQAVVFDEAQDIEEIATTHLGETLSTMQLKELADDIDRLFKEDGTRKKVRVKRDILNLRNAAQAIELLFEQGEGKGRIDAGTLQELSKGPGRSAKRALEKLKEEMNGMPVEDGVPDLLALRAGQILGLAERVLKSEPPKWLNWYEKRMRSLAIHASPLNVSDQLNALLFSKLETVVFTSATISTQGNFDYIKSRLGVPDNCLEGIYPSHFDFKTQTLLFIPEGLAPPNDPDFPRSAARTITHILERTSGRALVLFTSHYNMNTFYRFLKGKISYPVFRQGEAPRSMILEEFKRDIHSVLLATGSFWKGVDVPGESLSCLIVDKLPFDSPGEPLVAARIAAILERGGNAFMEYQIPSAIITLKQGLGRLIRKSTDRGVLSILDTRLLTSRYGRFFFESLPEIPITHDMNDIGSFFEQRA
jgi:ATP-dependent DNA helicase DinG